jgi:hypothetical protein
MVIVPSPVKNGSRQSCVPRDLRTPAG